MVGNNEDLDMGRRPGAEDWRWSSTGRVLNGRMIGWLDDAMCGLYHAQEDKEREFLSLASKPSLSGFPICASKLTAPIW
jgi:hypothetical protein